MIPSPADLVLTGAAVYTVDPRRPWAEAVAISGGRIVSVGTAGEVGDLIGPGTRVLDLPGRMVLPGFQDAHVHPPMGGMARLLCELHEQDPASYEAIIAGYAAANPDEPWILGGGWRMDAFAGGTPGKEVLDRLVPDRPVFLENRDGHGAWVNSRAMELAGIDARTPDPTDGRIERDRSGEPSGSLHEGAMDLVGRLVPPPPPEQWERAILEAQAYLHSLGITAWQDAWVTPETEPAYVALAGRGVLTARVVAALWWDRHRGREQIDELRDRRERASVGRFRATSVKIMQDGVCENFTAGMLGPYLDAGGSPTANRGLSFVEPEALKAAVTALDAGGFQVHFHAIGDRAVREALDACEAARTANGAGDGRHHIAHIQVVHPDDVPRFAELGVVANAQPYWACHEPQMDELTVPFLGPERTTHQYPFRSVLASGARLAMGSDWSVSTPNPLLEMEVAVTRTGSDTRDLDPFLPAECLSLEQALAAFTSGSAFVNHLDDLTGTIEAGKLADLVVLDHNLFDPGAGPVGDGRILLTMVDGEAVFADPGLGP